MMKHLFGLAVLGGLALVLNPGSLRAAEGKAGLRVVVHINFSDAQRQGHGLKNIENILKGTKEKTSVEVVCHGAGLSLLVKSATTQAEKVAGLMKQGVRFAACENTMKEKGITKGNLLAGVMTVPSGAIEVIRKQHEGFAYFKP